jgi:hypothetical protein
MENKNHLFCSKCALLIASQGKQVIEKENMELFAL